jgi:hypothetical protein
LGEHNNFGIRIAITQQRNGGRRTEQIANTIVANHEDLVDTGEMMTGHVFMVNMLKL